MSTVWEDTGWEEWGFDLRTRKLIMQAWLENTKTINPHYTVEDEAVESSPFQGEVSGSESRPRYQF